MGIARALDTAGINPVLERDLGDQTWGKSLADVVLVSETAARTDAKRSLGTIRRKFPRARILVHGEARDPSHIATLIAEGADGYFTLSQGEDKLIKALQVVAGGSVWIPAAAVASIVDAVRFGATVSPHLSDDERWMLRMLEQGLSNKEMAQEQDVSEVTIKARFARLYRRFGVNTRVQLLSYAVRNGLLPHQ